jgi:cytochrome c oxidase assembly protein subunit 15
MAANNNPWLRRFSKLTCFSTLFLIFAGSLVTSTGSGLAVPDWPLSYGTLFPPMVGGIFYEHGHRMVASLVGLFMLILSVWLARVEERRWVRNLGFCALGAVIVQGILGGITVLFFLPTPVSVAHGVLAQTFFILTIIIVYSQSMEREQREEAADGGSSDRLVRIAFLFVVVVYLQLILGAMMRHTHSGLAIPDFPTMGGYVLPPFNDDMLSRINRWRFDINLDPVIMLQVVLHFLHRAGAMILLVALAVLNFTFWNSSKSGLAPAGTVLLLDVLVAIQIGLGMMTVLSIKDPMITSFHVVTGAAILGMSFLLFLRTAPLTLPTFKKKLL